MEIEFKAQQVDNKEWVYGYYYEECGNTLIIENKQKKSLLYKNIPHEVIPETVCQYIGVKDKNGIKVYDKDIINSNYHWQNEKGYIISFPEDCYDFMEYLGHSTFDGSVCEEIEVIGNKFDEN